MLTSREVATLIILATALLIVLVVPKFRAHMAPSTVALVRAAVAPRLVWVYVIVVFVVAASTALAWLIGLWDASLLKDTVIIMLTVIFPMTFRAIAFTSGGELAHRLIRETFALTVLLTFYLDSAPLPLGWEIVYQLAAIFFVMMQAVSGTKPEWVAAKRLFDVVVGLLGAFLLIWTTVSLVQNPPDWSAFFQSLFFGFWLPLSLLPFFYVLGFYAAADKALARFRAIKRPLSPRVTAALVIGTRLRLSLLARFNGRYSSVADASGFREGLARMRQFRDDMTRRDNEEADRLGALASNAGMIGIEDDGLHRDRREFDVTKRRLDWIWTCQNGQYERQGNRYWDHLTDWIVDAEKHGLPLDHGFVVEVADDGQVWRAWRRTPGGAVLAVGGRERRSMFYYQGDDPPAQWPLQGASGWRGAAREEWPPDWNHNDSSRL